MSKKIFRKGESPVLTTAAKRYEVQPLVSDIVELLMKTGWDHEQILDVLTLCVAAVLGAQKALKEEWEAGSVTESPTICHLKSLGFTSHQIEVLLAIARKRERSE